jgi:thioredoxin-related protein
MKRSVIVLMLLVLGMIQGYSQTASPAGVSFLHDLSWQEILQKAKAENKYIFVDCYATWCGPCKMMDKDVYPAQKIGELINGKFLAVKVQMDVTKKDDSAVVAWYADAHIIDRQYRINGYPSFLFFSPEGKIVHRGIGYKDVNGFISLATDAMDPAKQYYTLLESYRQGKISNDRMPELARTVKALGEDSLAYQIGEGWVNDYLLHLSEEELYTKANLRLLLEFTHAVKGKAFGVIRANQIRIDSIFWEEAAERKIVAMIGQEKVKPYLGNPKTNWRTIEKKLRRNYGHLGELAYSEQLLGDAWGRKDWKNFGKYYNLYFETVGPLNIFHINNISWDLFEHEKDKKILAAGAKEMEYDIATFDKEDPNSYDTYANLLYKSGERTQALGWEQKAMALEQHKAAEQSRTPDKGFSETLLKMQSNEPTWEVNSGTN